MKWKWLLLALLALAASARAQDQLEELRAKAIAANLHWQDGTIFIDRAKARFRLDDKFHYLAAQDARKVLEELWGNPPDDSVLGLVVPKDRSVLEDASWAVVVTYSDEGHVSDEDATGIDYDELLADMKSGEEEENEERRKTGYPAIDLIGWAEPPHYDATSKKLYWARELQAEGASGRTLNYDIRVLGRHGYLSLNAVAAMRELPDVKVGMQQLLPLVEFDTGARYADYDRRTDKLAAYGVAALIGGTIAAKAGLFGKLGVLLLGLKKLLIPVFLLIAAWFKKIVGVFARKSRRADRSGGNV